MTPQDNGKKSLTRRWGDYQPEKSTLLWACVATAAVTMMVGFTWGGWVTASTSREGAATAGRTAHAELASAICVERFSAAPDASSLLVEFSAIGDNNGRRQFVEAGGWATMPGQTSPNRQIAISCAAALAA